MEQIPWKNQTKAHPNGVCEAATSTWLRQILTEGIKPANDLTPEECDELQDLCERNIYTWAVSLVDYLGGPMKAAFDAWNSGATITDAAVLKAELDKMKDKDFFIISAANRDGEGHSVAGYKEAGIFYFFDPNWAIYMSDDSGEIAVTAYANLSVWTELALRTGSLKK